MGYLILMLKGALYGVTHVLPGLGGSLVLILMGIYEDFVEAVGNILLDRAGLARRLRFLVPLGIGMVIGIVVAAVVLAGFLERFPGPTQVFFMGLMLGTIPSVLRLHGDMHPTWGRAFACLLGLSLVVALRALEAQVATGAKLTLADLDRLPAAGYNLLISFLGGGASVTPGMDGSTALIIGGTYQPILEAVRALTQFQIHWLPLLSTTVGVLLGIVIFSKAIHSIIKRSPSVAYYGVLGLILGSLYALWPRQGPNAPWWVLVLTLLAGVGAALALGGREPQQE